MEFLGIKIDALHFLGGDLATSRILPAIQPASYGQPFRSRSLGNEIHDGFIITQRLAPPI